MKEEVAPEKEETGGGAYTPVPEIVIPLAEWERMKQIEDVATTICRSFGAGWFECRNHIRRMRDILGLVPAEETEDFKRIWNESVETWKANGGR